MALTQHLNISERFRQQYENAEAYLLPFIEQVMPVSPGMKVLEVGCGEGGVLKAFTDKGCWVLGVDLSPSRIDRAREQMETECVQGKADFLVKNVYDADFCDQWAGKFDWILLKDTIEHIPNQEAFIPHLKQFLSSRGKIFFGFPPWCMPFGGHQQICRNKWLSKLPYYHLLPRHLYRKVLEAGKEPEGVIRELLAIKATGISLHRFERIVKASGLNIQGRTLFLLNPIYRYKFGWKPIQQARWIGGIPYFRDFVTTAGWYVVGPDSVSQEG